MVDQCGGHAAPTNQYHVHRLMTKDMDEVCTHIFTHSHHELIHPAHESTRSSHTHTHARTHQSFTHPSPPRWTSGSAVCRLRLRPNTAPSWDTCSTGTARGWIGVKAWMCIGGCVSGVWWCVCVCECVYAGLWV